MRELQIGEILNLSTIPNFNGTWHSSDENIATITEEGLVTPISPGIVTITYEYVDSFDCKGISYYDIEVMGQTCIPPDPENWSIDENNRYFKLCESKWTSQPTTNDCGIRSTNNAFSVTGTRIYLDDFSNIWDVSYGSTPIISNGGNCNRIKHNYDYIVYSNSGNGFIIYEGQEYGPGKLNGRIFTGIRNKITFITNGDAIVYPDGVNLLYPNKTVSGVITETIVENTLNNLNTSTSGLWQSTSSTTGPLNRVGIQPKVYPPRYEDYGFNICLPELIVGKTYYFGIAGDNNVTIKVDGKQVIYTDTCSDIVHTPFSYWHMIPIKVTRPNMAFQLLVFDLGGSTALGATIYDPNPNNDPNINGADLLIACTSYNTNTGISKNLKTYEVWTSLELSTGDTNCSYRLNYGNGMGYECPDGYVWNECSGCCEKIIYYCNELDEITNSTCECETCEPCIGQE